MSGIDFFLVYLIGFLIFFAFTFRYVCNTFRNPNWWYWTPAFILSLLWPCIIFCLLWIFFAAIVMLIIAIVLFILWYLASFMLALKEV